MTSHLSPYLGFRDDARQAMEFYQSVFGGELSLGTFGEMHASDDPAEVDKIMHGQLVTPNGFLLMGSDTPNGMERSSTSNISLSVSGDDAEDLRRFFAALSEGGTVIEPLTVAPWGDEFGMLTDRFGVTWMVNVTGASAAV
ncbi:MULTISPECIES: VOC family protein [unclassified Curtobacterium]|jgi:PhnB protein|uniref:VOC family protein n=1 Tax=unclassified Curtobacterium TaxID=257496 RepID=UPI00188D5DBE|nr:MULTISPECIES: VOC family protein [unclassified Curtobacterium]MBF4591928.1 VOC family protein [Curtobacterium sp. VKM Ac-1395]MCY1693061.1 VOC family protein [Curtobacterium sp. SL109]